MKNLVLKNGSIWKVEADFYTINSEMEEEMIVNDHNEYLSEEIVNGFIDEFIGLYKDFGIIPNNTLVYGGNDSFYRILGIGFELEKKTLVLRINIHV